MKKKVFKNIYTYDALNQLVAVEAAEEKKYYSYDAAGNLVRVSSAPPGKEEALKPALGEEALKSVRPVKIKEPALEEKPAASLKEEAPATPVALDERFARLEEKYQDYNDEAQAGAISLEEFEEKVNALRFQDASGAWWQLSYYGDWLKWSEEAWVETKPPKAEK